MRAGAALDAAAFLRRNRKRLPNITLPERDYGEDRWERVALKDYFHASHKHAFALLKWAETHEGERDLALQALRVRARRRLTLRPSV